MSTPISIPKQQPHRQVLSEKEKASEFPESEGPYFAYTEVFENDLYFSAISTGSSKFVRVGRGGLPSFSFLISKYRASHKIEIDVVSVDLKDILCHVLNLSLAPDTEMLLPLTEILLHYDDLRDFLSSLSRKNPDHESTKELRLLMEDAVLERSLYSGFDINMWCRHNVLSSTLLRDIHLRNMDLGIMDIEECFSLGDITPGETNKYLADQHTRIEKLARKGNLGLLREYCEPLLRSRDIKIVFNATLLSQLLDKEFVQIYKYILELVERTRPVARTTPNLVHPDVTYHPLCVAIRLGHYRTVQTFVETEHQNFEGYIEEAPGDKDRIFDPLLAAVLWARSDIARLLIRNGAIYFSRLPQAYELAAQMELSDVLQALVPLHKPATLALGHMNDKYPAPKDHRLSSPARQAPNRTSFLPSPPGSNSSISGISSGLHGPRIDLQSDNSSTINCETTTIRELQAPSSTAPVHSVPPKDHSITNQIPSPPSTPRPNHEFSDNVSAEAPHNAHYPSKLVDYTDSYQLRYDLGRGFQLRLRRLCRRIDKLCDQYPDSLDFEDIRKQCANPNTVVQPGLSFLRNIMRNRAPSTLIPLLQALLVADALICKVPGRLKEREKEFTNDLRRWKTLVLQQEGDLDLFDKVVCAAWKIDVVPSDSSTVGEDSLQGFSNLVEGLVSHAAIKPPAPKPYGTRLRVVQRHFKDYGKDPQFNGQANRVIPTHVDNMGPSSEVVDPKVVLLLNSVAFNLLFTTSSSIQDIEDNRSLQPFLGTPASIDRSFMIVEDYLSFDSKVWGSHDSGIGMEISEEILNANDQGRAPRWCFPGSEDRNAEPVGNVDGDSDISIAAEERTANMLRDYPLTGLAGDVPGQASDFFPEFADLNTKPLNTVDKHSDSTISDEDQAMDTQCDSPPANMTGGAPNEACSHSGQAMNMSCDYPPTNITDGATSQAPNHFPGPACQNAEPLDTFNSITGDAPGSIAP
ncbi:hypothetical protein F53441_5182 [Fusarium austroafricanum]|uniref:Uncharacterized protein n=1 Tax=Fusarium austroafricanum TaxID=2364996 RepID=A0A8H4NZV8_9HYPO|nr:hypothetical protein F53441_5182 [Fusarium austroafricanum]